MSCVFSEPYYANPRFKGINFISSKGDGNTIALEWNKAYTNYNNHKICYNIYYSTSFEDVFSEGVKYVCIDQHITNAELTGFEPGQMYYFAVRPAEFDSTFINFGNLDGPSNDIKIYTSGILLNDISDTDLHIPVTDINNWPNYGIVKIGAELIRYSNKDLSTNSLVCLSISDRGFYNTKITLHQVDGFDGTHQHDPTVVLWEGFEEKNGIIYQVECKFDYPNEIRTDDGFKEADKKYLFSDLSSVEEKLENFPQYDYAGWRRTDPVELLAGACVGSYYGGESYCADSTEAVGTRIRGLSLEDHNNQRQEVLLNSTGEPCILLKRLWDGKVCSCVSASRETPEPRCPKCYGVGFYSGYTQFYNSRRSDRRIMVRFDPVQEQLESQDAGLESKVTHNCWTLAYPILRERDILIRFNEDGTEEFRYEILNVTRNRLTNEYFGAQKFSCQRIRKFDIIYQFGVFRDPSNFPEKLNTSIGMTPGPGGIVPHTHEIVVNEKITSLNQINQVTSVSQGHSHPIINGVVQEVLGHTHDIII